jgi:histidinol phosphatase-like enzyme
VAKGEELLYNYNGFYDEYPTDDFEQLNDWIHQIYSAELVQIAKSVYCL